MRSEPEQTRCLNLFELPKLREPGKDYDEQMTQLQIGLVKLQRQLTEKRQRLILVFEGMDAAGKGGAIKRLTNYLDPRGFEVHPIAAPVQDEAAHHYLRRFWLRLPPRGRIGIFDRSWYGRMLVEPIEGLCSAAEYARAAEEIRQFEKLLTDDGYIIRKFWLHVSKDEQLKRFKEREADPLRQWKLTADDWRNREKYDQYVSMANAMFLATDEPRSPWWLVDGNQKLAARLEVIRRVVACLEEQI